MTYITIEQRKKQMEVNQKFLKELIIDINSNEAYQNKKYLQEFDKIIKRNNLTKKCNNGNYCEPVFFTNQYGSNNVNISNVIHSNYYGHCTPSLF
jgi:hypothetical protein